MAMKTQSASLHVGGALILSLHRARHSDTEQSDEIAARLVY